MDPRYCANCGSRPEKPTCCWYEDGPEADDVQPHPLIAGKPWPEWSAEHRFLITLMMERFGGAAEERELLARLPWPEWRLLSCTFDPWGRWELSPLNYPCIRERFGKRVRFFLTDMARDAYEHHRRDEVAQSGFMPGFALGRYRGDPAAAAIITETG